jgi:hypothetical protein
MYIQGPELQLPTPCQPTVPPTTNAMVTPPSVISPHIVQTELDNMSLHNTSGSPSLPTPLPMTPPRPPPTHMDPEPSHNLSVTPSNNADISSFPISFNIPALKANIKELDTAFQGAEHDLMIAQLAGVDDKKLKELERNKVDALRVLAAEKVLLEEAEKAQTTPTIPQTVQATPIFTGPVYTIDPPKVLHRLQPRSAVPDLSFVYHNPSLHQHPSTPAPPLSPSPNRTAQTDSNLVPSPQLRRSSRKTKWQTGLAEVLSAKATHGKYLFFCLHKSIADVFV